jgi:hypothetical protein
MIAKGLNTAGVNKLFGVNIILNNINVKNGNSTGAN